MIASLCGKILFRGSETLILDVSGVGYEVHTVPRLLESMKAGDVVRLSVETVVREDMIRLYGFSGESERQCFRLLQSVQGVGAKHALALLQVMQPDGLYDAVLMEDMAMISRARGVGRRLAQRIVTELHRKVAGLSGSMAPGASSGPVAGPDDAAVIQGAGAGIRHDAVSALVNLGYDMSDARRAVTRACEDGNPAAIGSLIKKALKILASS